MKIAVGKFSADVPLVLARAERGQRPGRVRARGAMSFGERSMRSGASERTAYGVSSSYHHSPRHVVQSPATTRAGRDSSPPRLARAQRTPYTTATIYRRHTCPRDALSK